MTGKTHFAGGLSLGLATERLLAQLGEPIIELTGVIEMAGLPMPELLIVLTTLSFASLLPDLDHPNSTIANLPEITYKSLFRKRGRRQENVVLKGVREILRLIFGFLNFFTHGLAKVIAVVAGGHRKGTHWLLTSFVLTLLVYFLGQYINFPSLWLWFFVGYTSHLLLDMMTVAGVKIFAPFTQQTFYLLPKFMRPYSGGTFDIRLRYFCWLCVIFLLIWAIIPKEAF
jgi:membrane-bound metal-dependent hydrolase YbcI (DUF457 family)